MPRKHSAPQLVQHLLNFARRLRGSNSSRESLSPVGRAALINLPAEQKAEHGNFPAVCIGREASCQNQQKESSNENSVLERGRINLRVKFLKIVEQI